MSTETKKKHDVIERPQRHILVSSQKKLHGWWGGKRECTGERMLINPYNGCTLDCFFCYANALKWGYFKLFNEDKTVTVFKDYDRETARQLDSIDVASCGYLSPVTDPFQPLEGAYRLSEKIIGEFVKRNVPVEFITKARVPKGVFDLIPRQEHSFGQFSVLTVDERLRKRIVYGGSADTEGLFADMKRLSSLRYEKTGRNVHTVCRIDPVIPYVTSDRGMLTDLLRAASETGAGHVIASCMDIPATEKERILKYLYRLNPGPEYPYEKLYCESIDGDLNAHISFRKKLFSFLRAESERFGMTFALCMEYEKREGHEVAVSGGKTRRVPYRGLNEEFMNGTENCEGIDIPVYTRGGDGFYEDVKGNRRAVFRPAPGTGSCTGNCLRCGDAACGIEDLAMGRDLSSRKDFTYSDYRRWSKSLAEKQGKLF